MKLHELTMPLDWEWMPDEVFPTDVHFLLPPRGHLAKGMTLGVETGTCLLLPSQFADFRKGPRLHEIAVDRLVLRETAILSIPRTDGEAINVEAVDAAFRRASAKQGDAILLRTGWGAVAAESRGSQRYMLRSPYLTPEAAQRLASLMKDTASDLLLMDSALVGMPSKHLVPQWASMMPSPAAFPSEAARVYLRSYTPDRVAEDFAADHALAASGIMVVKKLVNCDAIGAGRVRVIVAPLHLVRGIGAPCRVLALEE